MGKSSGGSSALADQSSAEARRLAQIQGDIAQTIFQQTGPFRNATLGGTTLAEPVTIEDVQQSPLFPAVKQSTEQQFDRARENIIGTTPSGGVLDRLLANTEAARASSLAGAQGALAGEEQARRERAFQLATGAPAVSLGGLSSAAGTLSGIAGQQAAIAQAEADRSAGKSSGIGQGVGLLAASKI